jgi:hypothetical protein
MSDVFKQCLEWTIVATAVKRRHTWQILHFARCSGSTLKGLLFPTWACVSKRLTLRLDRVYEVDRDLERGV